MSAIRNVSDIFKDFFPQAGTRIKQYVVDRRREEKWERETCPKFTVESHHDNCGDLCRNIGVATWNDMWTHDC